MAYDGGRDKEAESGVDSESQPDGQPVEDAMDDKPACADQAGSVGRLTFLVVVVQKPLQGVEAQKTDEARADRYLC